MNIDTSLRNMLDTVVSVVPKLVVFLVIMVVGWLVARVLRKLVDKLLDKVGFDKLADRGGLRRFLGNYDPSQFVAMLVFYAILLITLQLAFGVFGPNPVSAIIAAIIAFLPQLFVAALIVVVVAAIAKAVHDVIVRAVGGLSYAPMLARAAQVAILVLGVIAALNQIGVATTVTMPVLITILATIGAILAIGIGGGLIAPMRERWERILTKGEREANNARAHLQARSSQRQEFTQGQHESAQYSGDYGQHPTTPLPGPPAPTGPAETGQYAPRSWPTS